MTATRPRPRFDPSINYYQVLDVPFGASKEEITRAYRGLIRLTHPDTFQDPVQRAKAEERAKLLNTAYSVLSRPEARQEYDRQLRATAVSDAIMQRYTGSGSGRSGPLRAPQRPPSPRVVRAQRRAQRSAVRQLVLLTAALVLCIFVILIVSVLAWQGVTALV